MAGPGAAADELSSIPVEDASGPHSFRLVRRHSSPPLPLLPQTLILAWFSCEGNLHHFFRETWAPLHATLTLLGAFTPAATVAVAANASAPLADLFFNECHAGSYIWPAPGSGTTDDRACKGDRFRSVLDMLPVSRDYDRNCIAWPSGVGATPGGAPLRCYAQAVVQASGWPEPAQDALRFVLQNSVDSCSAWNLTASAGASAPVRILVLQRLHRRLLNADDLVARIRAHAVLRAKAEVRVEVLDDKPLAFQFALAACYTEVLVGVHGAGLQWGVFTALSPALRPRGAMIELSSKAHGSYYTGSTYAPNRASVCLCDQEGVRNETTIARYSVGRVVDEVFLAKYADTHISDVDRVLTELVRMVDFVRHGGCADGKADCGSDRQQAV